MHRNAVPDVRDPVALHPVIEQECPNQVGAANLEPLAAVGDRGQADIVQQRAEVEHLVVELDAVSGGERSRKLVAPLAVGRDDRRALIEEPPHLGGERRRRRVDEITTHAFTGLAAIASISISHRSSQWSVTRTVSAGRRSPSTS